MKLYIVYFRTMDNSPEVTIECATANEAVAKDEFAKAKKEVAEWMEEDEYWTGQGEETGNWAEACMAEFDITEERNPGDTIFVLVQTTWYECVETTVEPYLYRENADSMVDFHKEEVKQIYPNIYPFYEDESFEGADHLCDEHVMVDVYFSVESVVIK